MTLPIQSSMELPLLKILSDSGGQLPMLEAVEKVTSYFKEITEKDRLEKLESGTNRWRNRVQWVRQKLIYNEELDGSTRGIWKITEKGKSRVQKEWSSWKPRYSEIETKKVEVKNLKVIEIISANPVERIDNAKKEIVDSVSNEILSILLKIEPSIFEDIVGKMLGKMGYGSIEVTGRSGDGGIDGECSLDELGLYKIHFQAKRWQNQVPAKEIRDFIGAIQTKRGDYGVFITTSDFSRDALETAKKSGKVKAINGRELAKLMIKYGLGVKKDSLEIPKIDNDFFEGF